MMWLKINGYEDRSKVLTILADNGYTVKFATKEQFDSYLKYDHFVVIVEEPDFPRYRVADLDKTNGIK